ncbi:peptidase M23 [Streptacidiphilus cavernicola]|uniref:Peptidase M23 n=1 Tax=Streptacidiphilus cavernicola TaxID=3342716 RepID=A0ABV6VZ60_9ACTN
MPQAWAGSYPEADCQPMPDNQRCLTLYYNSNRQGATVAYPVGGRAFGTDTFLTAGAGHGLAVKNDAASAWNWDVDGSYAVVYYYSTFSGPCDMIAPNTGTNRLTNTYNENAAFQFYNTKPTSCSEY